ncbi:MAG TPA: ribosome-associated translation inhibitor RaiA [Myxococcaceae bacterium]|nr:ribosome-associated translation inhibitor RaiA [Myxococcaceae bacterium]
MQVLVRGIHVNVDEGLREFVELHLRRALDRIFQQQAVQVEVHLVDTNGAAKGGVDKAARVTLHVPGLPAIHVEEVSDDVRKAAVGAADRLERAAKRWLDKHHHHAGGQTLADVAPEEP